MPSGNWRPLSAGLLGLTRGSVRIATFHSVAAHWLPQIVQSFLSLYPNIEFDISCELEYSSSELKLIQGDVDCAFVTLPLNIHANPPLRTIFLKQDPIYVALPLNHPLATAPAYPVSRFAEDALIYIRETHDRDITTIFDCCNVHPNTRYFMEDSYAIASMVESGMGVGIINGLIASRMPYHIAGPHGPSAVSGHRPGCALTGDALPGALPLFGIRPVLGRRTRQINARRILQRQYPPGILNMHFFCYAISPARERSI